VNWEWVATGKVLAACEKKFRNQNSVERLYELKCMKNKISRSSMAYDPPTTKYRHCILKLIIKIC